MIWIDAFLDRNEPLRRNDLCTAFGISKQLATLDIAAYREAYPKIIVYDVSIKGYLRYGNRSAFSKEVQEAVLVAQVKVKNIK